MDLLLTLVASGAADPVTAPLLAGSDDGTIGVMFPLLAGPAAFIAVYVGIYSYYRNTKKRHIFEKETDVKVGNLRQRDRRTGSNNRQKSRTMSGANSSDHLSRVRRVRVR
ncbi:MULTISPECIES: hypothetical protein [unclassified Brachybacterium]|uniref:hypothetical protein n=1 Tax=unclassified Brachybacterium TaxID=2623841 RepID=UPI001E415630|nr:hypothetical protein [Brachybacterium sp. UMB0905]